MKFHNWWNAPQTWAKVQEIDPLGSHASWMENFPWTRLANVALPAEQKPSPDRAGKARLVGKQMRDFYGDGNFGGYYQRADAEMLAIVGGGRDGNPCADCRRVGLTWTVLIWGAGAIGGTIGAYLAAGRARASSLSTRRRSMWPPSMRDGLRITGPIDEFTVQAPAFTPDTRDGRMGRRSCFASRRRIPRPPRTAWRPISRRRLVVSVQNGLNELVIREIVGKSSAPSAPSSTSARTTWSRALIIFGGRGAVVLGEIDGTLTTRRLRELHAALLDFEPNAIMTQNIWGFLWGKMAYGAQLFVTALTNESIADALADPAYRDHLHRHRQGSAAVATAQGITPEAFNGFDPHAFLPDTPTPPFRCARWTTWWSSTASRPRRTAVSGATWPCASARPRPMRNLAPS